jgi:putative endonuclease
MRNQEGSDEEPKLFRLHSYERDRHTVLYVGVTNDLARRASDHSLGRGGTFAKQYNANNLVYLEAFPDPQSAIAREKRRADCKREPRVARFVRRHVFT